MKKIVLKSLAITLSAISLLNISPINALDDKKLDEPQITQQVEKNGTIPEEKSDLFGEKFWFIVLGVEIAVIGGELVFLNASLQHKIEEIRNEYKKKFKHTEDNILTKCQEGIDWDWLACLQGLLHNRGVEISQKELFKGITGKSPGWFKITKKNKLKEIRGSSLLNFFNGDIDFAAVEKYINKEFKLKLWKEIINVTEDNTDYICNRIKTVYEKNNKKPFAICENTHIWRNLTGAVSMRMVNVVEIKDDDITIECPLTGLKRTEKIHNFAKRYNEYKSFRDRGVYLFGISPQQINEE